MINLCSCATIFRAPLAHGRGAVGETDVFGSVLRELDKVAATAKAGYFLVRIISLSSNLHTFFIFKASIIRLYTTTLNTRPFLGKLTL